MSTAFKRLMHYFVSQPFLVGIIFLAGFLRLYKIADYMTFLGDEGRDVLIAKGILEGDLVLLGPRSSAADFFYGPVYYYFITPFLWLFNYDPVGPAVMVAIIGTATVWLVYKVGKELLDSTLAGLFAASLYSVSPLVIAYSRSSWNPNPLPFVSLLLLYILYKALPQKSLFLFVISGILLGISMQLQYLALFLGTISLAFIFLGTWQVFRKIDIVLVIKRYVAIGIGFLIGFSPFLAFEVRHGFPNIKTIFRYIFTDNLKPIDYDAPAPLAIITNVLFRLFGRLVTRYPPPEQVNIAIEPYVFVLFVVTFALIVFSFIFLLKVKNAKALLLFSLWFILGVGFFGLYKDKIYDYHFGFMFTLPFLLVGNAFAGLYEWKKKKIFSAFALCLFIALFVFNLMANPFQSAPNRQKEQVEQIAEFVLSKTDRKPFNFALLTDGNSDHGYRYFFHLRGRDPVEIKNEAMDPKRNSIMDQLLIVCEDLSCRPLGDPLWEVAGFGRAEVVGEWQVSVVKVYKLVHYKEQ